MMLCGVDYPAKPDNDRRKIMLDNDNNKISRVMAGGGDCPIKSDNDRKSRIMNRGRAKMTVRKEQRPAVIFRRL